jgi:hypothetical protein
MLPLIILAGILYFLYLFLRHAVGRCFRDIAFFSSMMMSVFVMLILLFWLIVNAH